MDTLNEVMLVSESGNKAQTCSFYDLKTGTLISTVKDCSSVRHGLTFLSNEFLISALTDQPALKIWTLTKSCEDHKMTVAGYVSALVASNCGSYCLAGINKTIFVWEVMTGNLLAVLSGHAQKITCLRFSADDTHFISGGKDGVVLVWLFSEIVAVYTTENFKPHYVWMDHSAEVTDIFVGKLGVYARVATASRDATCKIYELDTGLQLLTVRVDHEITAVSMDPAEYYLVLGFSEGGIYRINLFANKSCELHFENDNKLAFLGHKDEITSLSVSAAGKYLLSGSADKSVRVWDMDNFSCLRVLKCDGYVTNAIITACPPGLKDGVQFHPRIHVCPFSRHFDDDVANDKMVKLKDSELSLFHHSSADEFFNSRVLNLTPESLEEMMRTKVSVEDMTSINAQMYNYALSDAFLEMSEAAKDSD